MKRALVDRAVAEKAKRNSILFSIFAGKREAAGQRNVSPDNGVTAVHVPWFVEVMHRAAKAAGHAGLFSEELGHASVGRCSTRQRVGVIAVSGDDVIVIAHSGNGADDDRFLPDVKMTETTNLLRLILLARAFLETPDEQHQ